MATRNFHETSSAVFEAYTCGLPYAWSHGSTRPVEKFYLETMLDDELLPMTLVRYALHTSYFCCPVQQNGSMSVCTLMRYPTFLGWMAYLQLFYVKVCVDWLIVVKTCSARMVSDTCNAKGYSRFC